ncbi:GPI mannosyltransferase 2 [Panaeolus papilionaceus]|nr:GPI mannosyltransferase 2 [Panaeolus papilionaceus]
MLNLFDHSPPFNHPFLRWDSIHFLNIAQQNYLYEHEWAFLPAISTVIKLFNWPQNSWLLHVFILLLGVDSCRTIYNLTLLKFKSKSYATLVALLSLIPTSPITLWFAPYNEPFFTNLSYHGMLACEQQQYVLAALFFTGAAAFRSNGVFLAGFTLWSLIVAPFLARRPIHPLKALFLSALVFLPFIAHHVSAYQTFCLSEEQVPEWCTRTFPSVYTYAQSKYWNVGFLRYWTPSQLPNILLALPTLSLIIAYSSYILLQPSKLSTYKHGSHISLGFLHLSTAVNSQTPHAIYSLFTCFILLFASHTQITLRVAASMPVLYWAAADLLIRHPTLGKLWITWSFLWGAISVVLWLAFLPPA